MKKRKLLAAFLAVMALAAGCGQKEDRENPDDKSSEQVEEEAPEMNSEAVTNAVLPEKLEEIPQEYFEESEYPGTLRFLYKGIIIKHNENRANLH